MSTILAPTTPTSSTPIPTAASTSRPTASRSSEADGVDDEDEVRALRHRAVERGANRARRLRAAARSAGRVAGRAMRSSSSRDPSSAPSSTARTPRRGYDWFASESRQSRSHGAAPSRPRAARARWVWPCRSRRGLRLARSSGWAPTARREPSSGSFERNACGRGASPPPFEMRRARDQRFFAALFLRAGLRAAVFLRAVAFLRAGFRPPSSCDVPACEPRSSCAPWPSCGPACVRPSSSALRSSFRRRLPGRGLLARSSACRLPGCGLPALRSSDVPASGPPSSWLPSSGAPACGPPSSSRRAASARLSSVLPFPSPFPSWLTKGPAPTTPSV